MAQILRRAEKGYRIPCLDGKVEGSILGLAPKWTGPSFADVLRSGLVTAVKEMPFMGVVVPV
jgi:hypothetical protein